MHSLLFSIIFFFYSDRQDFHNMSDEFIIAFYNHILRKPYWQIYTEAVDNATENQTGKCETSYKYILYKILLQSAVITKL